MPNQQNSISNEFVSQLIDIMNTFNGPISIVAESLLVTLLKNLKDHKIKDMIYSALCDTNIQLNTETIITIQKYREGV